MTAARLLLLCATAAVCAGCGDSSETPTSPTASEPRAILFSGTLQPRASRFYSYTLTTSGTVTAMLASLEQNGAPASHALELGLGIPAGTGCTATLTSTTAAALTSQLRHDANAGTYCVRIADTSGLPEPMNFTIRVVHP